MKKQTPLNLGKREQQIVEAVYRLGESSVADVREALFDPPSYSAVRAMLNLLVDKKVLVFRKDGRRYLYRPKTPKEKIRRTALRNLVRIFFNGQPADTLAALLDDSAGELTAEDLARMKQMIDDAETDNK